MDRLGCDVLLVWDRGGVTRSLRGDQLGREPRRVRLRSSLEAVAEAERRAKLPHESPARPLLIEVAGDNEEDCRNLALGAARLFYGEPKEVALVEAVTHLAQNPPDDAGPEPPANYFKAFYRA